MKLKFSFDNIRSFESIFDMVQNYTTEEIIEAVSDVSSLSYNDLSNYPMGGYSKGGTSGAYFFVISDLKRHIHHYQWLISIMADDNSLDVLLNLIRYRILPDIKFLEKAFSAYPQYFDPDIVTCSKDEVFVDCGGFTGDTTESYIQHMHSYKRIYTYEPSPVNILDSIKNLKKFHNIVIRQAGVGKKNSSTQFSREASASSFVHIADGTTSDTIDIVSLDEDIKESVSFIKMDIECFEIDALIGAKRHIIEDHPKLAICVYHIISDIWEVPRLISAIRPDYRFYIRHYNKDHNWESVIYAIPVKETAFQGKLTIDNKTSVYTIAPFFNWTNQQLTKDCGLLPYMLHRHFGCNAVMVGEMCGEYPALQSFTKGLQMDFLPNSKKDPAVYIDNCVKYIKRHYKTMDILILYGCYSNYGFMIEAYRQLRPEGRIYMALDANSHWMDRTLWTEKEFMYILNQCNLIATSSKKMQQYLSIKWPWKIEYIPNGYYDFNQTQKKETREKESIIITAGRIGTEQKATDILLEAFAAAYSSIPHWQLRLVGSVEKSFEPYIKNYFLKYPQLKDKIHFTGLIEDREQLWAEYARAKLFVLSSIYEGSPNVISEAQINGCAVLCSDIDAAYEMTGQGTCGYTFPTGDIQALTGLLITVCKEDETLARMGQAAAEYADREMDWNKIIKKFNYLLAESRCFECQK